MAVKNLYAWDVMYYLGNERDLCVERIWASSAELAEKGIRERHKDEFFELCDTHRAKGGTINASKE